MYVAHLWCQLGNITDFIKPVGVLSCFCLQAEFIFLWTTINEIVQHDTVDDEEVYSALRRCSVLIMTLGDVLNEASHADAQASSSSNNVDGKARTSLSRVSSSRPLETAELRAQGAAPEPRSKWALSLNQFNTAIATEPAITFFERNLPLNTNCFCEEDELEASVR